MLVAECEEAVYFMLAKQFIGGGKIVYSRSSRSFFCSTALSISWWAKYLRMRGR